MKTRLEVIENFKLKNKKVELAQAKLMAKKKLEGLSDEEKEVLANLKMLADKASVRMVGEMYSLLQTIEAN